MASVHARKPCRASDASPRSASVTGFCSGSQAFSNCSMAQAASPNSARPTMRELPFRVWKARRRVVCTARSPGSADSARTASSPASTTSQASSRKMSSRSSSLDGASSAGAGTGFGVAAAAIACSASSAPVKPASSCRRAASAARCAAFAKAGLSAKAAMAAISSSCPEMDSGGRRSSSNAAGADIGTTTPGSPSSSRSTPPGSGAGLSTTGPAGVARPDTCLSSPRVAS